MKSKEDRQEAYSKLTEVEKVNIKSMIIDLEKFDEKREAITLESYEVLKSVKASLDIFYDNYTTRVINLLKQGYEVD